MESLIKIVNKLQDVFAVIGEHKIDLPQIVVVGSQSSGKSSVLESLVGKSFLPRGTGIVTRAPLILQMIRYTNEERELILKKTKNNDIKEWACFLHNSETIFDKFDEVQKEIERRTDFLAGNNKGITHKPIVLKVYTQLYDLSFVDLPGITKVPVGDQPENIDEQIYNLILEYVKKPNSIILAVVTANTDPSTSESLQIARKIDPEGQRTIAVVTKLDLIDKGTTKDTADLLCGNKIPIKLGIIGVVNRSQKDINDNKSMEETLKSEKHFLITHYPDIHNKHGNKVLANTLQTNLIKHIKNTFPILLKNLQGTKDTLEEKFKTLQIPENKIGFMLSLLKDVKISYSDTINGNRKDVSDKILMGGAKISYIVNYQYIEKLNKIDPLHELTDDQISMIIINTAGIHNSSFMNDKALDVIIGRQLKSLIEPSLTAVDFVRAEMLKVFDFIEPRILETLQRFPKLNTDVRNVLYNTLENKVMDIKSFIKSYIETHQTCLNTTNPDYVSELVKSSSVLQEVFLAPDRIIMPSPTFNFKMPNNDEKKDANAIGFNNKLFQHKLCGINVLENSMEKSKQIKRHRNVCQCYFDFVRRQVRDCVPKRILHKMVILVLNDFEKELFEKIFNPHAVNRNFEEALLEEKGVMEDRKGTEVLLTAVNKALQNVIDIQCY